MSLGVVLGTASENIKARPPEAALWRMIRADLGISVHSASIACYFHLARTIGNFRRETGILPLNEALDSIWSDLKCLATKLMSPTEWNEFRSLMDAGRAPGYSADLYTSKVGDKLHWGPYGVLIRESAFKPMAFGSHDYLGIPEIIEDILLTLKIVYGLDLLDKYLEASKPCIVKFYSGSVTESEVESALIYVFASIHGLPDYLRRANCCYDGQGHPVPADKIIEIEYPDLPL